MNNTTEHNEGTEVEFFPGWLTSDQTTFTTIQREVEDAFSTPGATINGRYNIALTPQACDDWHYCEVAVASVERRDGKFFIKIQATHATSNVLY